MLEIQLDWQELCKKLFYTLGELTQTKVMQIKIEASNQVTFIICQVQPNN